MERAIIQQHLAGRKRTPIPNCRIVHVRYVTGTYEVFRQEQCLHQNMETHIRSYENAEALLAAFETAKARSAPLASPYKYVSDWFKQQFPNYAHAVTTEQHPGTITLISMPDVGAYKARA